MVRLNPHLGSSGLPFMNNITSALIQRQVTTKGQRQTTTEVHLCMDTKHQKLQGTETSVLARARRNVSRISLGIPRGHFPSPAKFFVFNSSYLVLFVLWDLPSCVPKRRFIPSHLSRRNKNLKYPISFRSRIFPLHVSGPNSVLSRPVSIGIEIFSFARQTGSHLTHRPDQ